LPVMGGAAFPRKDGQEYKWPAMAAKALSSRGRGVASTVPRLEGEEVLMLSVRANDRGTTPVGGRRSGEPYTRKRVRTVRGRVDGCPRGDTAFLIPPDPGGSPGARLSHA